MPSQGQLHEQDFGLIETMLWTMEQGFSLFDYHAARLQRSARVLGFKFRSAEFDAQLAQAVQHLPPRQTFRVRAVLQRDGKLEVAHAAITPVPNNALWRVTPAKTRFDSSWPLLLHKTTLRALYEDEFAAALELGADEVIFVNERGELCEGARCNIFLRRGGVFLTPALGCGVLPGTLRAQLLDSGQAQEAILAPADLINAEWYMGNSVRGLVRSELA